MEGIKLPVVFVCSLENEEGQSAVLHEADVLCEESELPPPMRVSLIRITGVEGKVVCLFSTVTTAFIPKPSCMIRC